MMTALEYLKTMQRMTQNCNIDCLDCPLFYRKNKTSKSCTEFIGTCPEIAIEIVENWAKEHPVKTFFTDFKEKYPNAPLDIDENPLCCPHHLGYTDITDDDDCMMDCKKCWNKELKEENNE